jgi:hypothetical protein
MTNKKNKVNTCSICGVEFLAYRTNSKHCYNSECSKKYKWLVNHGRVYNKGNDNFNPKMFLFKLKQKIMYNRKVKYLKEQGLYKEDNNE